MSQQNLEILSDERIAPSLLESEYPELIASTGSIASASSLATEDFLAVEYSLGSEYSLVSGDSLDSDYSLVSGDSLDSDYSLVSGDSLDAEYSLAPENPSFSQEIEVDSLTGVPSGSTINTLLGDRRPRPTTGINNAAVAIEVFSYTNQAKVTATVDVNLSPYIKHCIEEDYTDILLKCTVWGMDGGIFGRNDHLFNFSEKTITRAGNYTFSTYVDRSVFNEDPAWFNQGDEIAAKFSLTSSEPAIPVNYTAWTNTVTGRY